MGLSFNFKLDRPVKKRSIVRNENPWKSFTLGTTIENEELEKTSISKAGAIELSEVEEENLIPIDKVDEEHRLVRLLIQEPDSETSEKDIEKNCYDWMENSRRFEYAGGMINGRAKLVECMLAPVDFRSNGKKIKKSSWTMVIRINDDEILEELRSGVFKIAGKNVQEI